MYIHTDQNIPKIQEAFHSLKLQGHSSEVSFFNGRELQHKDLKNKNILLVRSVSKVNKDLLKNTSLDWIASATAGIDHIDLPYLKEQKIPFSYSAGSNAVSVVEYVLFCIFKYCYKYQKKIQSLTVGIVGCGNVGGRLKKKLEKSNIKVIAVDPFLSDKYPNEKYHKERDALSNCDIITTHTPLTTEKESLYPTKNMFCDSFFSKLNKDIFFINTSRGEVVEEKVLLNNLKNKKIKEICLDVWEKEPHITPQLFNHCLVATPHIAGYSRDGKLKGTQMIYNEYCKNNHLTPEWNYKKELDVTKRDIVYSRKKETDPSTEEIFLKIITQIYNFEEDHQRLANVMKEEKDIRKKGFDNLRKTYPMRYEWSNYHIVFEDSNSYEKFISLSGIASLFGKVYKKSAI